MSAPPKTAKKTPGAPEAPVVAGTHPGQVPVAAANKTAKTAAPTRSAAGDPWADLHPKRVWPD